MFPLMTNEEYADLFEQGLAPPNTMTMVRSWWNQLPKSIQDELRSRQPVMLMEEAQVPPPRAGT